MIARAGRGDIDAVVATLAASHVDYIWERWAVPFVDREARLATVYRAELELVALPYGEVWITDDAGSVAVWLPHGAHAGLETGARATLDDVCARAFGHHDAMVVAAGEAIDKAGESIDATGESTDATGGSVNATGESIDGVVERGAKTGWYLATMGTLPNRQGAGLGSAVLGPMLARCDAEALVARLETSDERNVRFYSRLGFVTSNEVSDLPGGAPTTWLMQRSPRGSR